MESSGTTSYVQMRQRLTCTRMMRREEYGEGKELPMIQSIPPHQWSMVVVVLWRGHVWLLMEPVPLYLLMIWQLKKAAGWILKCFGQYYLLIFSQMLQNSLEGALKRDTKSFLRQRGEKWNVMQCPSQSPDLNPIEHAFHLLKTKLKGKCPKNKQELKTAAVEHHQGQNPAAGDVCLMWCQTSGCHWLQRICNQVLKVITSWLCHFKSIVVTYRVKTVKTVNVQTLIMVYFQSVGDTYFYFRYFKYILVIILLYFCLKTLQMQEIMQYFYNAVLLLK